MTDKQVIIDEVDVSGCRYYKESLNLKNMHIDSCKGYGFCIHNLPPREFVISPRYNIPRCHGQKFCNYKQLKRKEQECELKDKDIKFLTKCLDNSFKTQQDSELHWEKEKKKLKAENEQLKEELSAIQHNCSREGCKYYDDNTFKVFYECKAQKALQLSANSVTTKYCDLLKTLAEIKEIAEKCRNSLYGYDQEKYPKQILNKISEVLNDE